MTTPEENERRRQVSERYLAEVEARPRAVKPFVNAMCAELGINGNEWRRWLQREATDHALRWHRAKLLWVEARDSTIKANPGLGLSALAKRLGIHRTTVDAVRKRAQAKQTKTPSVRVGAGLRVLPDDILKAISAFEQRVEAHEHGGDLSDPRDARARFTAAYRRALKKSYVRRTSGRMTPARQAQREAEAREAYRRLSSSTFLLTYRPDLYARYHDVVDAFWQRVVLDAMAIGQRAAARKHEVSSGEPIRQRLRRLEAGKEVNRMVMRDGAIEILPPRYKKPKENVHDHQHADWEGY